jgi:formamidopyrimidine-DNA glycosylase
VLEIAEAIVLSEQLDKTVCNKRIKKVTAGLSPHKFAFFHGDPAAYNDLMKGKLITGARSNSGQLELKLEDIYLVLGDGVALQYYEKDAKRPVKHQLMIEFEDASCLCASVQMYGFLWCFKEGEFDNPYYLVGKEKPSPLTQAFDSDYFDKLLNAPGMEKLSAKAFLATEQRIPGLGNGVLQDILYYAGIHPKRKLKTLTDTDKEKLFRSVKDTLREMVSLGGRDTEKDLFGKNGGYVTRLSKNTVDKPCPVCGSIIAKEAYLGGSIYYCSGCQH